MSNKRTTKEEVKTNRSYTNPAASRYLTSEKKRYYLASADGNIDLLLNQQKEDLTRVLIDLKSEYDKLTRETEIKKTETEELQKKIIMLEQTDSKLKKKNDEVNSTNETMKEAIEIKKKKKEEEVYSNKTLQKQIEKLKTDILLLQKDIIIQENETKKLDKIYDKERAKENDIRQRYNNVYSKILEQEKQNNDEKKEQDLLIKHYRDIIEQKNNFIQSADERKERQKKIAQEAKNDSQDKQEVERRRELELVMLYNTYLRHKMEEQLKSNEDIEEVYEEIRDICGTQNLNYLVDFIVHKDKNYNLSVATIKNCELEKVKMKKELEELKLKFVSLKNKILIQEESNAQCKDVSTIDTQLMEEDDAKLLEEEEHLEEKLMLLQEKHKNIALSYDKLLDNIHYLINFQKNNYDSIIDQHEQEQKMKEEEKKNPEPDEQKEPKIEQNPEEVEKKPEELQQVDDNKPQEEEQNNNQPQEEGEKNNEVNNENAEPKKEEGKKLTKKKKKLLRNKSKIAASENSNTLNISISENVHNNPKTTRAVSENYFQLNNNIGALIGGNQEKNNQGDNQNQQNGEIKSDVEIKETKQETELISNYKQTLQKILKTFDILFLCHSKAEFLNIMREKGSEMQEKGERTQARRVTRRRGTRESNASIRYNTSVENKKSYNPFDHDFESDDENQKEDDYILREYQNRIKKEKEDFIFGEPADKEKKKLPALKKP